MLRLRLLGSFELRGPGDRPLKVTARKCRALLAFLALQDGARQSRERLAALLWEEADTELARSSLRQALTALRRALPVRLQGCIEADAQQVALDLAQVEVDVRAPAQPARRGQHRLAEGRASARRAHAARWLRRPLGRLRRMAGRRTSRLAPRVGGGRRPARHPVPRRQRRRRRDRRPQLAARDRAAAGGRTSRADGELRAHGALHGGTPPVPALPHDPAPRARSRPRSRD